MRQQLLVALSLLLLGGGSLAQTFPPPFNLLTSYLYEPLGIDTPNPRLSWTLNHPEFSQAQTAFRVQVWQTIGSSEVPVWDSEMVNSSHHYTTYGSVGSYKPLSSDSTYTWQAMWWDANGVASNWSEPASFGTGYLSQSGWVAQWIGGLGNLLRTEFTLSSPVTRARVYVSGLGYYEMYINGQRVGDAHLDVGWTNYAARCLYNVYDVTSMLTEGANAIGVMQGHGWYASTEAGEPNGPRSLILQLSVNDEVVVTSNAANWTNAQGPIVADNIYNGETYDARLEQPGWATPGFVGGSSWEAALVVTSPGCVLTYQAMPPVTENVIVTPKKITNPQNGVYVIDFEQNFSGWVRISLVGPEGANVTLRHAEVLQHDGSGMIYTANLRSAKATDTYIFNGSTTAEVYEPHFTYHGFRYVEWTSSDSSLVPTLDNIVGIHAYSGVLQTGDITFTASSNILNMIQHNILWGQTSNLMSVPTDCDQRDERKGWMGDAQLSAEEAIHNFYMPAFYVNFLQDIQDEQDTNGTITDTVPFTFGSRPADPAWGSAYPSILYWMWKYYDDIELVELHYPSIKMYINFLVSEHNRTGLLNYFYNYGDWVPPPPSQMCDSHMTSSFAFVSNVELFIEMAEATGNTADVKTYTALYNALLTEYNTAFFNTSGNVYFGSLQTAQALPLWLDAVPIKNFPNFTVNLLNNIVSYHDTHLTTGIIGAKYLMLDLHKIGRDDLALELAEKFDYPSWGYMAVNPIEPATTLWELWDTPSGSPSMDSRNHIMFGSVGDWFYKALAGIDHAPEDEGFAEFIIAPSVVGDLTAVSASFEAGYGPISVAWQLQGGETVCGTAPEGYELELDCASIGSQGVITEITFASFGLPRGTCGSFGENKACRAPKAKYLIEEQCVGKQSCKFLVHEDVLGDAQCDAGTFKRAHVQAKCSEAIDTSLSLQASIPVGSTADVFLPLLDRSNVNVTVNGMTVWENNTFVSGAAGISAASRVGLAIALTAGSGDYSFSLTGNQGSIVCANTTEQDNLTMTCPEGEVFTQIQFASFGDPYGDCENLMVGSCNAGSSKYVVEQYCLLKQECFFWLSDTEFGDPCFGTPKSIAIRAVCAAL